MPITMQQVLSYLNADEPNYQQAAALGGEALPQLEELVRGPDPMLASKAAYLAGVIADRRSADLVQLAADRSETIVRLAAAAAATHLPAAAGAPVLIKLFADADPEVRRVAIESTPATINKELRTALEQLVRADPEPFLRSRSAEVLRRRSP
jgi:HEAT repeat protein